jgi:prepilin-type processing-associated H-X9-DG protein
MEARHNQLANVVWCDNHIKTVRLEAVFGRWEGQKFVPTLDPVDRYFDLE